MKYYYIDGDDADYLYLGRESKLDIKLCAHCKMVLNRDEAIFQAAETVKWRKKEILCDNIRRCEYCKPTFLRNIS